MPIIARRLVDLIPRLKNLLIRRLWRGTYPMTPDGIAVVGDVPTVKGLYLGVGMCGQGFMMGPGVGANLAKLISKGKPKMDDGVFKMLSCERNYCIEKEELLK
jgi:sarcosine oxidase subunit beta